MQRIKSQLKGIVANRSTVKAKGKKRREQNKKCSSLSSSSDFVAAFEGKWGYHEKGNAKEQAGSIY
jgi:hypothetical protein